MLHTLMFEKVLGLTPESQAKESHITYYKDTPSGRAALASGKFQVAIFMNPTGVEQMEAVAGKGLKMPQKSTFFYPKLLTGLVINPIVPRERVTGQ